MTDLELLRETLRERENLAPDPIVVLARTQASLQQRWSVRRAAAFTTAVAATAGVLVAGATLTTGDRPSGPAPVPLAPAAPQLTTVAPAQSPPTVLKVYLGDSGDPQGAYRFCPMNSADDGPACVIVGIVNGTAPTTWRHTKDGKEIPLRPDGDLLVSEDGRVVVRQQNAEHWISVTSESANTATLKEIARSELIG